MPDRWHAGQARWGRRGFLLLLAVGVAAAFWSVGIPERAGEAQAWREAGAFLSGFLAPRLDGTFLAGLVRPAIDTIAMAVLGTVLALIIALPLSMLACRTILGGASLLAQGRRLSLPLRCLWCAGRTTAIVLGGIPEVLWAVILVRVLGLGPAAGAISLGLAYGGIMAKVYSEQLETLDPAPASALEAVGATRGQVWLWGILPRFAPVCVSYAAYRFECSLRASAIMGFVGAGGLGFRIEEASGYSRYDELATCIIVLVLLVSLMEWVADRVRGRLA